MTCERHPLFEKAGKFTINRRDLGELSDWVQQLMARVIIVRAESDFMRDGVTYTALSPEFMKCDPRCETPIYFPVVENGRFLRWDGILDGVRA